MKNYFLLIALFVSLSSFLHNDDKINEIYKKLAIKKYDTYSKLNNGIKLLNLKLSENEYQELINLAEKKENPLIKIIALNSLGEIYKQQFEYSLSRKYYNKVLDIAKVLKYNNKKEVLLFTYNNLGICYRKDSHYQKALDFHKKALEVAVKYKEPSIFIYRNISTAQNSVGEIYRVLKLYKRSIEQLNKALEIDIKIKNTEGVAENYNSIGKSYEELNQLEKALEYYKKSLQLNIQNNLSTETTISKKRIANIYFLKGVNIKDSNPEIAEKLFKKGKELIEEVFKDTHYTKNKKNKARIHGILGKIQIETGELYFAEKNLNKAFSYVEESDYSYVSYCYSLAKLYEKTRNYTEAIKYLRKGIEKNEEFNKKQNNLYINDLIAKYESKEKEAQTKQLQASLKQKEFESDRTRNILIITLITLALLGVALYSIYRQGLLNNDKKLLTLEQQALQAQMNPHFVFNALNSIKLYIINNEQRQAVYYLNKFAKLIRNILEISKKGEITLAEELETMNLYVTIENIRFNNEIQYECIIEDTKLALDIIKVPPLILQPFIENAIWHGLSSKKKDKKVKLIVSTKNNNLIEIKIVDNGIGRDNAMAIKQGKSLKRRSVGIELTKERLNTFSSDYITECYVKYKDKKDAEGNSLGTEVVIGIPLK